LSPATGGRAKKTQITIAPATAPISGRISSRRNAPTSEIRSSTGLGAASTVALISDIPFRD
jgi:hypothetical protein